MNSATISLEDILSGSGSIEATALAEYTTTGFTNSEGIDMINSSGHLLIVLGNHYNSIQEYIQQGNFMEYGKYYYLGNFPFQHLRCDFNDLSEGPMVSFIDKQIIHQLSWIIPANIPNTEGTKEYSARIIRVLETTRQVTAIWAADDIQNTYYRLDRTTSNLSALSYVVDDSLYSGIEMIHDLAFTTDQHPQRVEGESSTYHRAIGVIYWPEAIVWEID